MRILLLLLFVLQSFCLQSFAADKVAKPNIVVIMVDDMGYGDPTCFNSESKILTPHIDSLARDGMRFTDAHAPGPLCHMSRSGLLTGRYPFRTDVSRWRKQPLIESGQTTIASLLQTQGYHTAMVGKWHLGFEENGYDKPLPGGPVDHGFDSYFGIPYSNDMDGVKGKNRNLDRAWIERDISPWNVPLLRNTKEIERPVNQNTIIERYTQEAQQFIHSNKDKPFFVYLPHTFPHLPLFASPDFHGKSANGRYGDAIEEIDWSTGQILDCLDRLELTENTLVIFTSDNGSNGRNGGSNQPLSGGKGLTMEGGGCECP